ncbi:hypothetical protein [Actinocorallia aurantiaca]|uniref:Lipoprotein n=1 Tax=Actinocorallia aurantiaca TaxID=46204 RepID=A0ABN3U6N6_9ACTN
MGGWRGHRILGAVALVLVAGCQGEIEDQGALEGQPVLGLVKVTDSAPMSSEGVRSASAKCPDDKRVISGGGRVVGGGREVRLTSLAPLEEENAYRVRAAEDHDGYRGRWRLEAYALCAAPLIGLDYVTSTSEDTYSSTRAGSAEADCREGSAVLGGGVDASSHEDGITPAFGIRSFGFRVETGIAKAYAPLISEAKGVTAHAVCADPVRLFLSDESTVESTESSGDTLTTEVKCPFEFDLSILGADIRAIRRDSSATGVSPAQELGLTSLWVAPDLKSVTLSAHRLKSFSSEWQLSGTAVCGTVLG